MHALFFDLKRAFYASLRVTGPALAREGLTPARFDLLYAMYGDPYAPRPLGAWWPTRQAALRRKLGVSRTTVSRMVRALEALGLLTRARVHARTHHLDLRLTRDGLARVRRLVRLHLRGRADKVVDGILERPHVCPIPARGVAWGASGAAREPANPIALKERCSFDLRCFRRAGGDAATLVYPWHPDD